MRPTTLALACFALALSTNVQARPLVPLGCEALSDTTNSIVVDGSYAYIADNWGQMFPVRI